MKFHVQEKQIKQEVVIAKFTNGKLNEKCEDNIKFGIFENNQEREQRQRRKRTLIAETDRLTYEGHEVKTDDFRQLICVVDKDTQKIRVYDAGVYLTKPKVNADDDEDDLKKELSYMEKNDKLTSAFGSSKKRRAMSSRHKNKIEGDVLDAAVGSALDQTLSQPDIMDVESPAQQQQLNSDVIPPFDEHATTPQNVYRLRDIINPAEIEALQGTSKVFTESTREDISIWRKEEKYGLFVLERLRTLPVQEQSRNHKATCLLYLHYLIHLYKLNTKELKRKDALPLEVPDLVRKNIFDYYTLTVPGAGGKRVRCRPARLKDKLLSYILVLCMIIDEFNLEYSSLLKDLKISESRITQYLRALGFKVSKQKIEGGYEGEIRTATLPLPLTFPEIRAKAQKAKR